MVGHWSYPIFASQETTKPEYSILQALSTKNQMIHTKTGGLITQNQTTWHIKSPTAPLQFRDDCFGISSRRTAYRHGFGEVSYCDIHHGQFVVRHIQQCTRLPILGQAEHGVQRAGGETVASNAYSSDMENKPPSTNGSLRSPLFMNARISEVTNSNTGGMAYPCKPP